MGHLTLRIFERLSVEGVLLVVASLVEADRGYMQEWRHGKMFATFATLDHHWIRLSHLFFASE